MDSATLNLVASLLVVFAGTYLWTTERKWALWWTSTYGLAGLGIGVFALFLTGTPFKLEPVYFGLAVLLGITGGALAKTEAHLPANKHLPSLMAGVALAALTLLIAANYRWWIAPLILLALVVGGLAVNYAWPGLKALRAGHPQPMAAASTPPAASTSGAKTKTKPAGPIPGTVPPPADHILDVDGADGGDQRIRFRCANCAHPGQIPATRLGATLVCPRCRSRIRVTSSTTKKAA